jgi:DNA-binding NarL/FixJ family response regulator
VSPREGVLTARARQMLSYLSHGYAHAEIAEELGVSLATVRVHVQKLLEDLGARNAAHATRIGFEDGHLKNSDSRRPRKERAEAVSR